MLYHDHTKLVQENIFSGQGALVLFPQVKEGRMYHHLAMPGRVPTQERKLFLSAGTYFSLPCAVVQY